MATLVRGALPANNLVFSFFYLVYFFSIPLFGGHTGKSTTAYELSVFLSSFIFHIHTSGWQCQEVNFGWVLSASQVLLQDCAHPQELCLWLAKVEWCDFFYWPSEWEWCDGCWSDATSHLRRTPGCQYQPIRAPPHSLHTLPLTVGLKMQKMKVKSESESAPPHTPVPTHTHSSCTLQ